MAESIINVARSMAAEAYSLTSEAVMSGTWSYPLLGVTYIASHRSLYQAIVPAVVKVIMASIGITAGLFFFTFLPQLAFCAIFSGPLAFIPATIMVLGESYLLVSFVARTFFLSAAQDMLFDAVLLQQGNQRLVESGREIRSSSSGLKTLGKSMTKPLSRFSAEGLLRELISLPLNSIPFIGSALFLLYNGSKLGPAFHARYFQLKKFDSFQANEFITKKRGAYTAFGAMALALNLVPIAGFVFNLTSTVGAALWASKMEKANNLDEMSAGIQSRKPDELDARAEINVTF